MAWRRDAWHRNDCNSAQGGIGGWQSHDTDGTDSQWSWDSWGGGGWGRGWVPNSQQSDEAHEAWGFPVDHVAHGLAWEPQSVPTSLPKLAELLSTSPQTSRPASSPPEPPPGSGGGDSAVSELALSGAGTTEEPDEPTDRRSRPRKPAGRLWCEVLLRRLRQPDFDLVPMLIGRGGCNMRDIHAATNAKIRIRGRGSGYFEVDGKREAPVPLMVVITSDRQDASGFAQAVERAVSEVRGVAERFRTFCRERSIKPPQGPLYMIGELSKEAEKLLASAFPSAAPVNSSASACPSLEELLASKKTREAGGGREPTQRHRSEVLVEAQPAGFRLSAGAVPAYAPLSTGVCGPPPGMPPLEFLAFTPAGGEEEWGGGMPSDVQAGQWQAGAAQSLVVPVGETKGSVHSSDEEELDLNKLIASEVSLFLTSHA